MKIIEYNYNIQRAIILAHTQLNPEIVVAHCQHINYTCN